MIIIEQNSHQVDSYLYFILKILTDFRRKGGRDIVEKQREENRLCNISILAIRGLKSSVNWQY